MGGGPDVSLMIEHPRDDRLAHTEREGAGVRGRAGGRLPEYLHGGGGGVDAQRRANHPASSRDSPRSRHKAALSHEACQKAEAEVQGALLAVERDESRWCVHRAWTHGLPCQQRSDTSPLAVADPSTAYPPAPVA